METIIVSTVEGVMDDLKMSEFILDRTEEIFFSEGLSGFTMDSLAADLGVSKKTLYRLIPSKNDLVLKVVSRRLDAVKEQQDEIFADGSLAYREKLHMMLKIVSSVLGRIRKKTILELSHVSPQLWEMIRARRMEVLSGMTLILEEGRDAGQVRSDIPLSFINRHFQQLLDGLVTPRASLDEDMSPSELMETALTLFFEGVGTSRKEGKRHGLR